MKWTPERLDQILASGSDAQITVECATPREAKLLREALYRRRERPYTCTIAQLGRNLILTPMGEPILKTGGDT